jgi:tetratricopeptide (TPR) repeat protein
MRRPASAAFATHLCTASLCAAALLAGCSSSPPRSAKAIQAAGLDTQGMDRLKSGDYARALPLFQQALVIEQSIEDETAIAATRMNLSLAYEGLGQQKEAVQTLDQVLDPQSPLVFSQAQRAEAALRRGMLAVQLHDRALADRSLELALKLCTGSCTVQAKVLNLQAYLALADGKPDQALKLAQQAQGSIGKSKSDPIEYANALRLQASALVALRTLPAALAAAQEALTLDKAAGASTKIYQDLLLLGQAAANPADARSYWTRAHDVAVAAGNDAGAQQATRLMAGLP